MTYQKFITDPMPEYSKGEEIFNYVSHIVGGAVGVFLVIFSSIWYGVSNISLFSYFGMMIFSVSIILLYTISTLYHALKKGSIAKRVFRIMDHCTIYLLIAGTYTPICLIALEGSIYCTIILLIEWGSAILGILLKVIDMNNKIIKVISTLLYVIMGWGIIMFPEAIKMMSVYQFIMILSGGIAYTVGIYFFVTGKNNKWYHSIFHIFCCIGTIVQMLGIIDIFLA